LCRRTDTQTYLFDRDEWRKVAPLLEDDAIPPAPIVAHYIPEWHERWSKYLLISAEGSGINFHRHTNAFNGLVFGRKRWFLYPPNVEPPKLTMGSLPWFRTVYKPYWAAKRDEPVGSAGRQGKGGLEQCMQEEGDLMYVPQHWWHATVALGEGIGLSGQFVRRLSEILNRVSVNAKAGRAADALRDLEFIIQNRDEVEGQVVVACATDVAAIYLDMGQPGKSEEAARLALELAERHGVEDVSRANGILREVQTMRK